MNATFGSSGVGPAATDWAQLPRHRAWLSAECDRLLDFASAAAHPDGGFAWLDQAGNPELDRPVETWITCRMTHVFALAHLMGRPGAGPLADHGVAALSGRFHDSEHGGWFASVDANGPVDPCKRAYEHAFVVLAASSATAAGRVGAAALLDQALEISESRFWRSDDRLVVDVWDRAWRDLEPYRGVNANMHTVEAYLAASDVTGDQVWRQRALRITERVVHRWGREFNWRIPEHFDVDWQPQLEYNSKDRAHAFRPYGATVGHWLEWARLCLHLRAALGNAAPDWLLTDAVGLFSAATDTWGIDGYEGLVYTVDQSGAPVVRDRLHWVITEAIAAAAALHQATGNNAYESWYRTFWDHAETRFIDRAGGSWWHGLDATGGKSNSVWNGKPDVYHAVQATLIPQLPLSPVLSVALATVGLHP
jgi:sulfoquinovose isomerase